MDDRAPSQPLEPPDPPDLDGAVDSAADAPVLAVPDLSSLPVAGITRRRVAFLIAAICSVWVVIVFAKQVGESAAATAKAEAMRAHNAALAAEVAALEREYELIQSPDYIVQQGRAFRLGNPREIPFTALERRLPVNAPGSASVRLGAVAEAPPTPLESWLSLLFGPGR
jgi:cell division protein FtsB